MSITATPQNLNRAAFFVSSLMAQLLWTPAADSRPLNWLTCLSKAH